MLTSIQGRLTAIALFFIIGTSVAMGVVGFRLTVNFEKARFRDHFSLLASYLASNAELGVMLGNKKILQGLSKNMLEVRDVQVVEVLDQNGESIIKVAHEGLPAELGSVSAPVVSDPMEAGDSPFLGQGKTQEVVGEVKLSFSYAGLEQLKKLLALRFFLVSLVLSLAPVAMYWMLSRAIIAPMHGLLDVAGQVSRGLMSVRAQGGSLQEIDTLSGAINEMLDTLEAQRVKLNAAHEAIARQQALAEVGKFSMIVAHEIKNPLAIIKGSVDLLKKGKELDVGVQAQIMGFLDEEIERINKLIEDFLLFAKPQDPVMRPLALSDLVDSMAKRVALMPGGKSVLLAYDQVLADRELCCDPQLMERAVLNVIRNALEVSPAGGKVRVGLRQAEGNLVLTVDDDGPGVAPEHRARIFEPFYSSKAKGTGLGLAIVSDIITLHGGDVAVEGGANGGACFTITLPLTG